MAIETLKNWKLSAGGNPIPLYHSDSYFMPSKKPRVIFIGGVHGDEPAGVRLAEELLQWLQSTVAESPLWKIEWALIPCLNPDGFNCQQRVNHNGVDLNRNYPSTSWEKSPSKDRYYSGDFAGSEPEIKALISLIEKQKPESLVHFHSWKPCIVKSGGDPLGIAQKLAQSSQYEVVDDIGYKTPGSLSQYGWRDRQITVICTEEDDEQSLESTWQRWGPGLKSLFLD